MAGLGGAAGAGGFPWTAALGLGFGLYGGMEEDRQQKKRHDAMKLAIQMQIKKWKQAYERSAKEFESERTAILGREQTGFGQVTAGLAGSGLLNTTVGGNMARGVRHDTNLALGELASRRSAAEYGKWMDLGNIKSQWANIHGVQTQPQPGATAAGWGQFGAELGNLGQLAGLF